MVIYDAVLRNVYSVLFLIVIGYIMYLCYKTGERFIFNPKEQLKKPKWNISGKQIVGVGVPLLSIYQVFKVMGPGQNYIELERAFISAIMDFIPLIIMFTPMVLLLFVKPLLCYFYLTKYSERFRKKFNYDIDHWHG